MESSLVWPAVTSSLLGQNTLNLLSSLRVKDQFHTCVKQQVDILYSNLYVHRWETERQNTFNQMIKWILQTEFVLNFFLKVILVYH